MPKPALHCNHEFQTLVALVLCLWRAEGTF